MYVANRERVKAEHRFGQVRALANRVLRLDSQIRLLPGSTAARHEVVVMAKDYLEALRPDAEADIDLALELAFAYYRLASAQGVPSTANLGLSSDAAESLGHAEALFDSVLARTPRHPTALLQSANVFEARMMLADNARRDEEALRHARQAVERVDLFLAGGQATDAQKFAAAQLLGNVALFHKNAGLYAEAIAYARRNIALVPAVDRADEYPRAVVEHHRRRHAALGRSGWSSAPRSANRAACSSTCLRAMRPGFRHDSTSCGAKVSFWARKAGSASAAQTKPSSPFRALSICR